MSKRQGGYMKWRHILVILMLLAFIATELVGAIVAIRQKFRNDAAEMASEIQLDIAAVQNAIASGDEALLESNMHALSARINELRDNFYVSSEAPELILALDEYCDTLGSDETRDVLKLQFASRILTTSVDDSDDKAVRSALEIYDNQLSTIKSDDLRDIVDTLRSFTSGSLNSLRVIADCQNMGDAECLREQKTKLQQEADGIATTTEEFSRQLADRYAASEIIDSLNALKDV